MQYNYEPGEAGVEGDEMPDFGEPGMELAGEENLRLFRLTAETYKLKNRIGRYQRRLIKEGLMAKRRS